MPCFALLPARVDVRQPVLMAVPIGLPSPPANGMKTAHRNSIFWLYLLRDRRARGFNSIIVRPWNSEACGCLNTFCVKDNVFGEKHD